MTVALEDAVSEPHSGAQIMFVQRTPTAVSPQVKELCSQINPHAQPVYITITPEAGCLPNDCFACVRQKMAHIGGQIRWGWAIWEWPRVFVEAEHHAVYEPPTGPPWIDITPSPFPEIKRRLFLLDEHATYDFENEGVRRYNRRLALGDDALIQEFFAAASEEETIWDSIPGIGAFSIDTKTAARLSAVQNRKEQLVYQLAMKYTPQNAPCFCASGKKFKRCHGSMRL
jgi:hypothetical protein